MIARALILCMVLATSASADDDAGAVTGFVTYGVGELRGTVADDDGQPLAGAMVSILPSAGPHQQVMTDVHGQYRATLDGEATYALVFVRGRARIGGQIMVPAAGDDSVVEIHDTLPPMAPPKLVSRPYVIPPYTEAARDQNAWTRAWLMLEIDEQGLVARCKFVGRPGYDLERGALDETWKLRFQPARDRTNRPIRAIAVWSFEWPAFWWLRDHTFRNDRLPGDVNRVPCRGRGGMATYFRDCSRADLGQALTEAWVERPR